MSTNFHGNLTKPQPSRVVSEKCEPVSVFLTAANLGCALLTPLGQNGGPVEGSVTKFGDASKN